LLSWVQHHKDRITDKLDQERLRHIVHFTYLFQVEQLARLGDWEGVLPAIKGASVSELAMNLDTYEAIADILWVEKECPSDVLYLSLEVSYSMYAATWANGLDNTRSSCTPA